MYRVAVISFYFLLFTIDSFCQIDITFPTERIVFQRNQANKAIVHIAGNLTIPCDFIEARMSPFGGYQGTDTGWKKITSTVSNGFYQGEIDAAGGWYKLEVRAFRSGEQVAYSSINRVGVGEVFAVAGQSNAEGQPVYEGATNGVQDDRISSINFRDTYFEVSELPFVFSKLSDNTQIAPYNPTPWIWAVMAEKIVKQYGVPVLLYGCAVGGTSSSLWRRSAQGEDLRDVEAFLVKFNGSPYQVLGRTLRNYASRTGIRAILWQQGESDFNNSEENYFDNVKYVIEQSRRDIKADIPWMIAVASRTPDPSYAVTIAQRKLIENVPSTFAGPNTDLIFGSNVRVDGIHFFRDGITQAGTAWFNAIISSNIINNGKPISNLGLAKIQLDCAPNNQEVKISIQNSGITTNWTNGSSTNSAQIASGPINARVYNANGLRLNFPEIRIKNINSINPSIKLDGASEFCEGENTQIIASNAVNPLWQNGENTSIIFPKITGSYFFKSKNIYGCDFESSKIDLTVYPKPRPELNFSGSIQRICEDDVLEVNMKTSYPQYLWDNGSTAPSRTISAAGDYSLKVTSDKGCVSDISTFSVKKLTRPEAPYVERKGFFTLSLASSLSTGDELEWYLSDQILEPKDNTIKVSSSGFYRARVQKLFEFENQSLSCPSFFSNEVLMDIGNARIAAYPNPSSGNISVESFEEEGPLEVWLYTINGILVSKSTFPNIKDVNSLSFSDYPNGTYILNIKAGRYRYSQQLIIQK